MQGLVRGLKLPLMAALLAAITLTACDDEGVSNTQETRSLTHAAGTTPIPLHPQKVVVFDTAMLDTMDALGLPVAGVPQTTVTYPPFLAKYQGQPYFNAGGLFEPNFQALSAAAPDLIIGGGRASKAYGELSKIAPTIDLNVDDEHFADSFRQRILQLGDIFGQQDQARAALADLDQKTAAVRGKAEQAGTGLIILINGGRLSAYGPGSRFGFIHDVLGFKPAIDLPDKGLHGNAMSFELLQQANPDWLFVISRDAAIGTQGAASAQQVLDNELVQRTKAYQNGHIVYLDSAEMYVAGGLQTFRHLTAMVDHALSAKP
ncbi:siderophore ABC transporter substrate-binding protein [Insolitispirillum peregrinum]|uniref:siderophore ABC transporter substrate-binding protein n=1 Tax=Insolitispirillum peregrinum TaxID=80876 RepID=UPI00361AB9BC